MAPEDKNLISIIRSEGIGIARGVLSCEELSAVRLDFDRAHQDLEKGYGQPGARDRLTGTQLLKYPEIAELYSHPRIMDIVCEMLTDSTPWIWQIITNRYNPEHPGVGRHSDGFKGELSSPFSRQSMAVFLDDIDEDSGSLTYVPGSHLRHFISEDDPERQAPAQTDIDKGAYITTKLTAGDVVFRVPEVWHAVRPIHRLRRYVTASYVARDRLSAEMNVRLGRELETRLTIPLEQVPEGLQPYWIW